MVEVEVTLRDGRGTERVEERQVGLARTAGEALVFSASVWVYVV